METHSSKAVDIKTVATDKKIVFFIDFFYFAWKVRASEKTDIKIIDTAPFTWL